MSVLFKAAGVVSAKRGKEKFMKKALVFILVLVVIVPTTACRMDSDEDRIRQLLSDIQAAGEKKDIRAFMNPISKDYHDPQGFNYEGIRALVFGYFLRWGKISVYISHSNISVDDGTAKARLQTVLTGGEKTGGLSGIIPQSLGMWDFDITLQKETQGWRVTSAVWKEAEYLIPDD
jgi:hypothetical protein